MVCFMCGKLMVMLLMIMLVFGDAANEARQASFVQKARCLPVNNDGADDAMDKRQSIHRVDCKGADHAHHMGVLKIYVGDL